MTSERIATAVVALLMAVAGVIVVVLLSTLAFAAAKAALAGDIGGWATLLVLAAGGIFTWALYRFTAS